MTIHGIIHSILGVLVFSLSPVTCIVFFRRFRGVEQWRRFGRWTLFAAVLMTVLILLWKVPGFTSAGLSSVDEQVQGGHQ